VARAAATADDQPRGRVSRRLFGLFVTAVVVVGVLFTFVNPTRQWLDQRGNISAAHERVDVLDKRSADLAARAEQLRTDAEVERLAREQYGLVKPGEQAYAILPTQAPAPPAAPPEASKKKSGWAKVWDTITFW
jgi:cell division protein FtsB